MADRDCTSPWDFSFKKIINAWAIFWHTDILPSNKSVFFFGKTHLTQGFKSFLFRLIPIMAVIKNRLQLGNSSISSDASSFGGLDQ